MNKQEQINFVSDLCDAIKLRMIRKITEGKVPDNWDGIELRWWIADSSESCIMGGRPKRGHINYWRYREYNNAMIVNDL